MQVITVDNEIYITDKIIFMPSEITTIKCDMGFFTDEKGIIHNIKLENVKEIKD